MFRLFTFFFFVFLTSFAQSKYAAVTIPDEFRTNANSVILEDKVTVDVTQPERVQINTNWAIAVLSKSGSKNIHAVEYYDSETRIKKLEAYVYDAFGNEIEHYKKNDFKDVSVADGFSLFNDNRALFIEYTPTSFPYTLVFTSEVERNDSAFIKPWEPYIDRYANSVLQSEYTVVFNPENKIRFRAENIDKYDINIQEDINKIVCSTKNLKAIKYEEHAPSFESFQPKVIFALNHFYLQGTRGFGKDWKEFGQWMNSSLLTGVSELPETTKTMIKSLVASETTNEGKARKIYEFVQNKVRYISVQVGIGGWKPMLAEDVDKLSYGDCKALTNYTKALLDAVEVPSYYTILYAGNEEKDIVSDFSSMQGNHVILGVPINDNITWLECTSQDTPFGYLGNFTDDRDVLMITPQGGKLSHTTIYPQDENLQNTTANISMQQDGSAIAEINRVSKGLQYDDIYRLPLQTNEEIIEYYKEDWSYLNGITIERLEHTNDTENIIFTEKVSVNIPNYATKAGKEYLIELNVFNQSYYVPPRIKNREQMLNLSMAYVDVDAYTITFPSEYYMDSLPEDVLIENKFGSYSLIFKKEGESTVNYKREIKINKGLFSAKDYNSYRSFRRSISKFDKTKILIKTKS